MWNISDVNYICRILTCDDDNKCLYRFDILYTDNLVITDNKKYNTFDECADALHVYLKKLYAHKSNEPLTVAL